MISVRQFIGSNQCYYNENGEANDYCNSAWYEWGRWVLLGGLVIAALLFFFLVSCISARRRRRFGRQPFYGTGWAAHGVPQYNPNYQTQQPANNYNHAAPAYPQQENGGYYGQNQGYFGGQETGTEMQPPQNSYRASENVYQPPTGAPPKKT